MRRGIGGWFRGAGIEAQTGTTMTAPPEHSPGTPAAPGFHPRRPPLRDLYRQLRSAASDRIRSLRRRLRSRLSPWEPRPALGVLYPIGEEGLGGGWVYHDETWVRVIHRFEHRRLLREGRALVVKDNQQPMSDEVVCRADGSIWADVAPHTQQEWVWLHLDPSQNLWKDFRWEFTARRDTPFRELQFGFRYVDFYNRYRFRHEGDYLHFDIVVNGAFWNSIHQVPFVMEIGRKYRWRIEARDNRFILAIDGVVLLDELDKRRLFPRGSIAVIFWEDDARTPIRASITDNNAIEI